jgi:hypothetical protein
MINYLTFQFPITDHRPPTTDHRPPTTDKEHYAFAR